MFHWHLIRRVEQLLVGLPVLMGTYVEVTGNLVKRDRTSQGAALLGLQALNGILKNLVLTQCTFAIDSVNLFNLCARFVDTVF